MKTQGSLLNRLKSEKKIIAKTTTLGATFTILDCEYMKIILHELWLILKDVSFNRFSFKSKQEKNVLISKSK